jgi:hypothetical protein
MAPKMTSFLIGIVLVGLFVSVFIVYLGSINRTYATTEYNESTLAALNRMSEVSSQTQQVQGIATNISQPVGNINVLDALFGGAYRALKVSFNSFSIFQNMTQTIAAQSQLGSTGALFFNAGTTILLILLVIGVLIAAIVKWRDL